MAPVAKRKKPGDDDFSAKPAAKSWAKKQRTDTEPSAAIETPPPTPKPAATARGRKPAAAKNTKVNGSHDKTNGTAQVATEGTSVINNATGEDELMTDAAAVQPPALSLKRKSREGDSEAGATVNGQQNGVRGSQEASPAQLNGVSANLAKVATPAGQSSASEAAAGQSTPAATNGHVLSTASTTHPIESHTIRPTTEQHPAMEPPAAKKQKVKSKEDEMRKRLYQYCIKAKPVGEIYSIAELKKAGITKDDQDLLDMCQQLVQHFLFSAMTLNRGIVYKTRSYEVAKKLAILSEDHILIYSLIENAGGAGQWMRPLEGKSGMHQSKVRKCLKDLMVHKIVIELKSADTSRKTYISADVKPDEKHIGGGWMDEGKFDEAMINVMTGLAVRFLVEKGWYMQETRTSDVADHSNPITAKHKSKTPAVVTIGDDNATPAPAPANPESKERRLIPAWTYKKHNLLPHHPNHYLRYPTTLDVMLNINESGALRTVVLTQKDTEQLMEKMMFDGLVERMRDASGNMNLREPRWRAKKRVWKVNMQQPHLQEFGHVEPEPGLLLPGNGLSQVPCARCPVKAKCKPGGVVNPEECKYLEDWLAF